VIEHFQADRCLEKGGGYIKQKANWPPNPKRRKKTGGARKKGRNTNLLH